MRTDMAEVIKNAKAYLLSVVAGIIDHPEELSIHSSTDGEDIRLEISVYSDDMGRVIGRDGYNKMALEQIMIAWGGKNRIRVFVALNEPERRRERGNNRDRGHRRDRHRGNGSNRGRRDHSSRRAA